MVMANEEVRQKMVMEQEFLPAIDALYNFAFHLTYDEEEANDLVQETFLRALKAIDSYQEGTNAKAWLFKILKNHFINNYRKKMRQPIRVELEDATIYRQGEEGNAYPSYLDLDVQLFEQLLGDEVTFALDQLSEDYRMVVILADVEEFKYEEIAEILSVPIGTVRSRLHRARNMLSQQLEKYAESLGYTNNRK